MVNLDLSELVHYYSHVRIFVFALGWGVVSWIKSINKTNFGTKIAK